MELACYFEQGGVGVGRQEFYRILLGLKMLIRENTSLQSVRFWGESLQDCIDSSNIIMNQRLCVSPMDMKHGVKIHSYIHEKSSAAVPKEGRSTLDSCFGLLALISRVQHMYIHIYVHVAPLYNTRCIYCSPSLERHPDQQPLHVHNHFITLCACAAGVK